MSKVLSRRTMQAATVALCSQLILGTLHPSIAAAQDEGVSKAQRVLGLIGSANDKFDAEDFEGARDDYREAYSLYPDPSLLYRLGLSSEKIGENFEAVRYYEQFIDAVPDDKTAKKVSARIEEMRAELPARYQIESSPPEASVYLSSLESAALCTTPCSIDVPPGRATILVAKEGHETSVRNVDAVGAEEKTLKFELVEGTTPLAGVDFGARPEQSEGPGLGTWGWIATGVGVAALGTGAAFSFLSQSATDDANAYDKRAPGATPSELKGLKEDANSYYDTSVIMYVVGGVLTATGVTLLVVDSMGSESMSLNVSPTPDGAVVGLGGRF